MEYDFSGYATKNDLVCSDGRVIRAGAFKHNNGQKIPVIWRHQHKELDNVLGHAILEERPDGVYSYVTFNGSESGKKAKELVFHGDITALSIHADKLVHRGSDVVHGNIKEMSLVLFGANPGAFIDNINIKHEDGSYDELEDEALIYTDSGINLNLSHADATEGNQVDTKNEPTVKDIFDTLTEEQKNVVYFMIATAVEGDTATHDDDSAEDTIQHDSEEDNMSRNVFDKTTPHNAGPATTLTHEQLTTIVEDAKKCGSFKQSFLEHAVDYGIENIDFLFPDAKTLANSPEFIDRRQEWVSGVISGATKNPFSRIKTLSADITHEDARAKGYVKGNMKKEEWFSLEKRITTPTTIYKKQKLDRDDMIDITDLDVVAWLKAEMRGKLDEELARAMLVGDGREIDDPDKIDETHIRPIAFEDDFYAHKVTVPANVTGEALIEAILRARKFYRGVGNPDMYTHEDVITELVLLKDKMGRRLYPTIAELQTTLRVGKIVPVPVMEDLSTDGGDLLCVLVNMSDYTLGADHGGAISMFDDFDIDYNQYKYLMETRCSGALTGFKTALVFSRANGTMVTPTIPTFVPTTGIVTIPAKTGVAYFKDGVAATAGAQTAIAAGATVEISAEAATGYYFPHNTDADWEFIRNA